MAVLPWAHFLPSLCPDFLLLAVGEGMLMSVLVPDGVMIRAHQWALCHLPQVTPSGYHQEHHRSLSRLSLREELMSSLLQQTLPPSHTSVTAIQ